MIENLKEKFSAQYINYEHFYFATLHNNAVKLTLRRHEFLYKRIQSQTVDIKFFVPPAACHNYPLLNLLRPRLRWGAIVWLLLIISNPAKSNPKPKANNNRKASYTE